MAWQDYSILGGDITKDVQYEICKLVGGAALASDMVLRTRCLFSLDQQDTFLGKLPEIYSLCRSDNKIEETWNMQVLGLFVLENQTQTRGYIKRDSARVVWNHIKYELDNSSSFGWNTASSRRRQDIVDNLYQQFGRINFQGPHSPFGIELATPTPVATNAPAPADRNPCVELPVTRAYAQVGGTATISTSHAPVSLPVPPAPATATAPNILEIVNVTAGNMSGQHTVLNTVRGWSKYTYLSKQWSYRILSTNRGYIVQTRWCKTWRAAWQLRVTTKAFNSERQARAYVTRTVNTKIHNGYASVSP